MESDDSASEIDKLLDLAESMQRQYEDAYRRLENLRLQGLFLLTLLAIAIPFFSTSVGESNLKWLYLGIAVALFVPVAFMYSSLLRLARLRVYRVRRALVRVLDLLREVLSSHERDEQWGPLRRAQYQIRLSNFDIEPPRMRTGLLIKPRLR